MSGTANQGTYGNSGSPWGPGAQPDWRYYQGPPYWHWSTIPKPLLIAGMVLGFIFFWPVGLAVLIFMMWTGRMRACWGYRHNGGYQNQGWQAGPPPWAGWRNFWCGGGERPAPTSGNRAFDEYRAETLRRLEDEQKEFGAFLDRLRVAKDKAEFDQFMAERRNRPPAPQEPPPAQA